MSGENYVIAAKELYLEACDVLRDVHSDIQDALNEPGSMSDDTINKLMDAQDKIKKFVRVL